MLVFLNNSSHSKDLHTPKMEKLKKMKLKGNKERKDRLSGLKLVIERLTNGGKLETSKENWCERFVYRGIEDNEANELSRNVKPRPSGNKGGRTGIAYNKTRPETKNSIQDSIKSSTLSSFPGTRSNRKKKRTEEGAARGRSGGCLGGSVVEVAVGRLTVKKFVPRLVRIREEEEEWERL